MANGMKKQFFLALIPFFGFMIVWFIAASKIKKTNFATLVLFILSCAIGLMCVGVLYGMFVFPMLVGKMLPFYIGNILFVMVLSYTIILIEILFLKQNKHRNEKSIM